MSFTTIPIESRVCNGMSNSCNFGVQIKLERSSLIDLFHGSGHVIHSLHVVLGGEVATMRLFIIAFQSFSPLINTQRIEM